MTTERAFHASLLVLDLQQRWMREVGMWSQCRGSAPSLWGAEKGGLCAIESGHITITMTLKESVHPVDYGDMGKGH